MKPGIFVFILLSVLIHGIVFSLRDNRAIQYHDIKEQGGSLIHIDLSPQLVQQTTNHPPAKPPQIEKVLAKITETAELRPLDKGTPKPIIKNTTPVTTNSVATINDNIVFISKPAKNSTPPIKNHNNNKNENENEISDLLKNQLAKHFFYPRSALRRHRQGKVLISFDISREGYIRNILVKESSGFTILDNAAITSIKKIDIHTELERILNAKRSSVVLPVIYQLTK